VYKISSTSENASQTFAFDPQTENRDRSRWTVPTVDQVMAEERAAAFTRRSIKTSAKLEGLKLAVSMMDLTTLEGNDTPGKIAFLCRKATQPLDPRYQVSSCAAVASIQISLGSLEHFSGIPASKSPQSPPRFRPD
jgi:hypothetical protein